MDSPVVGKTEIYLPFRDDKKLLKQVLFTVAYYNVLGYYPTSFFIWKNLIDMKWSGEASSLLEILNIIDKLKSRNKLSEKNGLYEIVKTCLQERQGRKSVMSKVANYKKNIHQEYTYKQQIQKNKISTEKIKKARKWVRLSRWLPYLRGIFLTGTLAMKRGGINSDWDALVVLKKNRIWLGRLIITTWFHLIGKRRYNKKVQDRFCLNQFIANKELKFKENNEFLANELLVAEELLGNDRLKSKIIQKNKKWIKALKPNFKFRKNIKTKHTNRKNNFSKTIQKKLENILEVLMFAEMVNAISKKIMIKKIVDNPKTYALGADIRYSDFFLVFLPRPQRNRIKEEVFRELTKMNS